MLWLLALLSLTMGPALAPQATPEPKFAPAVSLDAAVRIEGSRDVLPILAALRPAFREATGAEIALSAGPGNREAVEALAAHAIDIALASDAPDPADLSRRGMEAHRIAVTPVVFAVHSDVARRDLASREICDIFEGRVTNWAALGGPDLPVKAYMRPETALDAEVVRAGIPCMKGLVFSPRVAIARTSGEMLVALQSVPGAIGVTTEAAVRHSIVALRSLSLDAVTSSPEGVLSGRYPLSRSAWLITDRAPSQGVLRFIEFARSEAGASAIAASGALPLR